MQKVFETMTKVCSGELSREEFIHFAPELYDRMMGLSSSPTPEPDPGIDTAPPQNDQDCFSEVAADASKELRTAIENAQIPNLRPLRLTNNNGQPYYTVQVGKRKIIIEMAHRIGYITTKGDTSTSDTVRTWSSRLSPNGRQSNPPRKELLFTGKPKEEIIRIIRDILEE